MNSGVTELFNINSFLLSIENGKSILNLTISYSFQKLQLNIIRKFMSVLRCTKRAVTLETKRERTWRNQSPSHQELGAQNLSPTLNGEIYEINKSKKE